jgi:hypothetical protein
LGEGSREFSPERMLKQRAMGRVGIFQGVAGGRASQRRDLA